LYATTNAPPSSSASPIIIVIISAFLFVARATIHFQFGISAVRFTLLAFSWIWKTFITLILTRGAIEVLHSQNIKPVDSIIPQEPI
jgi:hypothetical protein